MTDITPERVEREAQGWAAVGNHALAEALRALSDEVARLKADNAAKDGVILKQTAVLEEVRTNGTQIAADWCISEAVYQMVCEVLALAAADASVADHALMPLSDVNDLDEVVHELGIEDSDTTPAEAVRELKAELLAAREKLVGLGRKG